MGNRLYLIDVSNMFYRAFWGNEALTTSYGMPVQAIHGVTKMINALIRDNKPTHIVAGLEGGNLLRKQISPLYKANRSEKPEELAKQEEILPDLLKAMGIPAIKIEGYEADDVIGAYAKAAEVLNFDEIVIVSSDKDFSQLVTNKIRLYDMAKGLYYGPTEVLAKHGVTPAQFSDYLAICGDASDNVKGVDGIGPKGAAKLLNEFGNIEGIYANMSKVKGAQKDKLTASASDVELAMKLVKIQADELLQTHGIMIPPYKGVVETELRQLFKHLEFKTLEAEMFGTQTQVINGVEIGVRK